MDSALERLCDSIETTEAADLLKAMAEHVERALASEYKAGRDEARLEVQQELESVLDNRALLRASTAMIDVAKERIRQADHGPGGEGYDALHDDMHDHGELCGAAAAYALNASCLLYPHNGTPIEDPTLVGWMWDLSGWKPKNPRADLVRAAALIIAEIDRMDRNKGAADVPGA
jgi:hypothetical protein